MWINYFSHSSLKSRAPAKKIWYVYLFLSSCIRIHSFIILVNYSPSRISRSACVSYLNASDISFNNIAYARLSLSLSDAATILVCFGCDVVWILHELRCNWMKEQQQNWRKWRIGRNLWIAIFTLICKNRLCAKSGIFWLFVLHREHTYRRIQLHMDCAMNDITISYARRREWELYCLLYYVYILSDHTLSVAQLKINNGSIKILIRKILFNCRLWKLVLVICFLDRQY